jgi:subtilisin family serine protease
VRPYLILSLLCEAACVTAFAAPRSAPPVDLALSASFRLGRYVVDDSAQRVRVRNYLKNLGRDSSQNFSLIGNVLKLSPALEERLAAEEGGADTDPEKGRSRRRARLRLERAVGTGIEEETFAFPAEYIPDDMKLLTVPQWPMKNDGSYAGGVPGVDIGMTKVWERFDGGDTLVVAVLDAGYNFLHPDLQNTWYVNAAEANGVAGVDDDHNGFVDDVRGWDFVDGDNNAQDYHGHGTQTGGLIAATFDNGLGIAGMLPRVKILPVRVLGATGYGNSTDIANGIKYAAAMKVDAINFSIGIGGTGTTTVLRNAFIAARDSGVLVSAASGNDRANLDAATTQPASYKFDNIYIVGAHSQLNLMSGFSNYGATTVDLFAPGEHIATTSIPAPLLLFQENFETASTRWKAFPANGFAVVTDSIEGSKSLRWQTGARDTVLLDSIDLRGREGGQMSFSVQYTRSSSTDLLIVEAQAFGASAWDTLFYINGNVSSPTGVAADLGMMDGTYGRIRFRTCSGTNCSGAGSTASRVIRIDDIRVKYADMNPANQDKYYPDNGGTSLAAPYVAGYAALMKLAAKRKGVTLTRAMMLAGTTYADSLAGKVITNGRLDVAKGLDFYLRTLPQISVLDSTDTSWAAGTAVAYALSVSDSAGPKIGYTFSAISKPAGSTLTANGVFTWSTGAAPQGNYALRAKAVNGPITLRTMQRFTLSTPVSIGAAKAGESSLLRVGKRAFILPTAAFASPHHQLRLEFYGADGRTLRTITGELEMPRTPRSAEYRVSGLRGTGMRAWLNGIPLRAADKD